MKLLSGKLVIVTGSRRGIGRGAVESLLEAGACVVGCALGEDKTHQAPDDLKLEPHNHYYYRRCDVSDPWAMATFVNWVTRAFGRIDCLVNNAGIHPPTKWIDDFSVEEFIELFSINMLSMFVACKEALPHLRKTKGSIINMGSLVGQIGQEGATIYCATKGAISAFTKALAVDEGRRGVRVNAILPGTIYTPSTDVWAASYSNPQEKLNEISRWNWLGRQGTPLEAGDCVVFLASEMSGYITGHELIVSGGAELAYGIKTEKMDSEHLIALG